MSYSRNIARLKETSRSNLAFASQQRLNTAEREGKRRIAEAEDVATKLSGFSDTLYKWKLADIKQKKY